MLSESMKLDQADPDLQILKFPKLEESKLQQKQVNSFKINKEHTKNFIDITVGDVNSPDISPIVKQPSTFSPLRVSDRFIVSFK
mmetsp:Transcript_31015/g.35424  ORF Transcript_31015/g.35424 Transcript_31015/m.35424 type:complete len:84 (+) Transcript_31015:467-718(+)